MSAPELRTVKAIVTLDAYDEWREACNLIRSYLGLCGIERPTDSAIISAFAREVLTSEHLKDTLERKGHLHDALAGVRRCWFPVTIGGTPATLNGRALRICGIYVVEYHHLLPKSHGGHDGPQAPLCQRHHTHVTQCVGGFGWRELAAALGYKDIAEVG